MDPKITQFYNKRSGEDLYPITYESGVYGTDGTTLDVKLRNILSSISQLTTTLNTVLDNPSQAIDSINEIKDFLENISDTTLSDIINTIEDYVDNRVSSIPLATTTGNGLMSAEDKTKLNSLPTVHYIYIHNLTITGDSTTSIFTTILTSFSTPFDTSSFIAYMNNLDSPGGFMCSGTVRTNSSGIATGRTAARLVAGNSADTVGIVYHDTGDAGTTGPIYYSAGTGANKISSISDAVLSIQV